MKINPVIFIFFVTSFMPTLTMGTPIDQWTFEASQPATAGPVAPETGSGSASGSHANAATSWSSPSGNGSAHSFSSDHWTVGDYWQFSVSTVGFENISLGWDQTSSGSGPADFGLFYSIDGGTTFSQYGANYTVLGYNVSPNPTWGSTAHSQYSLSYDLSSILGLNNDASTVYFRLIDESTASASGGTVGTSGADRIDNFIVSGTDISNVPDSPPGFVGVFCLLGLLAVSRRISHVSSPSLVKINEGRRPCQDTDVHKIVRR
jgi:hypothetical protein